MRSRFRVGVHLVWATKDRTPWLVEGVRLQVLGLLKAILRRTNCHPLAVGGWVDHVHVYTELTPNLSVAALINLLKANSTGWIRRNLPGLAAFEWQRGYAATGVDPRDDEALRRYILSQERIHGARQANGTRRATPGVRNPTARGGREPTPPGVAAIADPSAGIARRSTVR